MIGNSPPIAGAEVTLICKRKVCPTVKTDSNGEFIFKDLAPGVFAVRVTRTGFYPLDEAVYNVREGMESVYWPLSIERCPHGDCNPRKRPKKPIAICE